MEVFFILFHLRHLRTLEIGCGEGTLLALRTSIVE